MRCDKCDRMAIHFYVHPFDVHHFGKIVSFDVCHKRCSIHRLHIGEFQEIWRKSKVSEKEYLVAKVMTS